MLIEKGTSILLFRYSNFKKVSFISAHQEMLENNKFVWMLKIGRRSSIQKLNEIEEFGGWMILRAPKSDGGKNYIVHFSEFTETNPESNYPFYYEEIIRDNVDNESFYNPNATYQWFKLTSINELPENDANNLVIATSGKKVNDVIGKTRTAVMFVKNNTPIKI